MNVGDGLAIEELHMQKNMPRRQFVKNSLAGGGVLIGVSAASAADAPAQNRPGPAAMDVTHLGAKGDGKSNDAKAIQAAIDACHGAGGGTVLIPAGTFLSGSLHLKTGVELHLDHGATLLGSPDRADYDVYETLGFKNDSDRETSFFHHALIWAEDQEHLAITGTGIIHGNHKKRGGPKAIALERCKHVKVRDVTIVEAPNYAISMLGTDYVHIDGVTILNAWADGIDPDACHHVSHFELPHRIARRRHLPQSEFYVGRAPVGGKLSRYQLCAGDRVQRLQIRHRIRRRFQKCQPNQLRMFSRPNKRPADSGSRCSRSTVRTSTASPSATL